MTYQSAIIVFMSSSGMVAMWPNFAKKHVIIWLEALLFLLNFTGRFSCGKPTPPTVASSRGHIGIPRFCLLLRYSKGEETFFHQTFLACGFTSPRYPASALHSGDGAPNGHSVSLRQGSREECKRYFPMKSS